MTSLMNMLFGNKPKTANVAKERLQLIIAHERVGNGHNFLPDLQRDLVAVISKYIPIDPEAIQVALDQQGRFEVLEVKIELPEKG